MINLYDKFFHNFYHDSTVDIIYESRYSRYFRVKYKDFVFNICLSDHLGLYRKGYYQFITTKKTIKNAKYFAYKLFNEKKYERIIK